MFLAEYILAKGMPGEARVHLKLAVDAPRKSVVGTGTITQPISPPLDITIDIHGKFVQLKHEVVVFVNSNEPTLLGRPDFHAILAMPRWGAEGEGAFGFTIGSTAYDSGPVPAKPIEVPATVNA